MKDGELDMLVCELDYENRLLRARNERLIRILEAHGIDPNEEPKANGPSVSRKEPVQE